MGGLSFCRQHRSLLKLIYFLDGSRGGSAVFGDVAPARQARVEEMAEDSRSLRAEVDRLTDRLLAEEGKVSGLSYSV